MTRQEKKKIEIDQFKVSTKWRKGQKQIALAKVTQPIETIWSLL